MLRVHTRRSLEHLHAATPAPTLPATREFHSLFKERIPKGRLGGRAQLDAGRTEDNSVRLVFPICHSLLAIRRFVFPRITHQRPHVLIGRVAHHFAACAHDVARPSLTMALCYGLHHRLRRALPQYPHRIDVAQQYLLVSHLAACVVERDQRVLVNNVRPQTPKALREMPGVAADVQPHPGV